MKSWLIVLFCVLLLGCQSSSKKNHLKGLKTYSLGTFCDVWVHHEKTIPVADYLTCNTNHPRNLRGCMIGYDWHTEKRWGKQCNVLAYTKVQIEECTEYANTDDIIDNKLMTQCFSRFKPKMTTDAVEPYKHIQYILGK